MTGHVHASGRALVTVRIRPSAAEVAHDLQAWVDTAFNGELVLPQQQIDDLSLPQSGTVTAVLADGSQVVLNTYSCLSDWFGASAIWRLWRMRASIRCWASVC